MSNYQKYMKDLLQYQYTQGEMEELDELVLIAA